MSDFAEIKITLDKLHIKLISVSEPVDETPIGEFIGNISIANARLENAIRSERVKASIEENILNGRWVWKSLIGYVNRTNDQATIKGENILNLIPKKLP